MVNNELMMLMACPDVVQSKIGDGSGRFALQNEEGDWTIVQYRDVIDYLDERIKRRLRDKMTKEEFMLLIRKADLMLRSQIVLMHTDTAEAVRAEWPEIDNEYVVCTSPNVDKSQCYLIDRADIEM